MLTLLRSGLAFLAGAAAAVTLSAAVPGAIAAAGYGGSRSHAVTTARAATAAFRGYTAVGDAAVNLPTVPITDPANAPIATLSVPAGSYLISARDWMHVSDPTDTIPANNVQCTLKAGSDSDFIQFDLFPPKIGDDAQETSSLLHTFKAPGTITWQCFQPSAGVTVQAIDRKLQAIRIGSVSTMEIQ
jgi:hypothetical protein